jgi:hypothetical protein
VLLKGRCGNPLGTTAEFGATLRLNRFMGNQWQLRRCPARQLAQLSALILLALAGDPPVGRGGEGREQQRKASSLEGQVAPELQRVWRQRWDAAGQAAAMGCSR